jgi:cold-inducible RNA-binding protein
MSMKLYVGNLSYGTTDESLAAMFASCGTVESASVITDRDSGRSRGFGFVEMSSRSEGETAIRDMHDQEVDGRTLVVNESRPRESRGGSSYSSNRRNY